MNTYGTMIHIYFITLVILVLLCTQIFHMDNLSFMGIDAPEQTVRDATNTIINFANSSSEGSIGSPSSSSSVETGKQIP